MNYPKAFCRDGGMTPSSAHSMFNRRADLITTGNVSSNVQYSTFVRARQQLECNGFTNEPGHLQEFDLKGFSSIHRDMAPVLEYIRRDPFFESNTAIAYSFHHYDGKARQLHGVIITDEHHRIVRRFDREDLVGRRSAKSASVLDFCKQFIAWPAAGAHASA